MLSDNFFLFFLLWEYLLCICWVAWWYPMVPTGFLHSFSILLSFCSSDYFQCSVFEFTDSSAWSTSFWSFLLHFSVQSLYFYLENFYFLIVLFLVLSSFLCYVLFSKFYLIFFICIVLKFTEFFKRIILSPFLSFHQSPFLWGC